jgi:ribonuclease Z
LTIYGPEHIGAVVSGLRVIAPELPYEIEIHELSDGDTFLLPGGLWGKALAGEHRVPVLVYRVGLDRARRFDPDRARALGIPLDRWRHLQNGEAVSWDGGQAVPGDVLGPDRPGVSFGFATDTRPTPGLPAFFAGVDLLITEGTYGNSDDLHKATRNKHMTYAEAATIAREADARGLWLTHFSPAMEDPDSYLDRATAIFPETTVGYSGLTTSLRFLDQDER